MSKFDQMYKKVIKEDFNDQGTSHMSDLNIEILRGQLILDVKGQKVKLVFQDSGDIDIFDSKGNVLDADAPNFDAINDFITKVVS